MQVSELLSLFSETDRVCLVEAETSVSDIVKTVHVYAQLLCNVNPSVINKIATRKVLSIRAMKMYGEPNEYPYTRILFAPVEEG